MGYNISSCCGVGGKSSLSPPRIGSLVAVVPDAVCKAFHVEPIEVLIGVKSVQIIVQLLVVAVLLLLLLLLIVVVHVVHGVHLHGRVLLVVLFHHLEVHLVVHLEALSLDLLLPVLVVDLHVVEYGVHQHANVRILVGEQLEHDRDHLGLV